MTRYLTLILLVALSFPAVNAFELPLPVSKLDREEPVDFATEIMPILKRNCLACHHQKEAEGGLVLETIDQIRAGGDSGAGAVAGDLDASLLFVRSTGTEEPLMPPEDNSVGAVPLTPDELGLLKLWIEQGAKGSDVIASEMIQWQPIPESIRSVYAMDVSADGRLAIVGRGNRVVLFDLQTNTQVGQLIDPSLQMGDVADYDLIQSVAAAPDGRRVATGGYRAVRIWRQTWDTVALDSTPLQSASHIVAASHDGKSVALVNTIGDVEIWDIETNTRSQTLRGNAEPIRGLQWTADGATLVSVDQSGLLNAWDPTSATAIASMDTKAATLDLAVAADSQHVATVDISGRVRVLRLSKDRSSFETIEGIDISNAVSVALIGTDKLVLAVATSAGPVDLVSLDSKQVVAQIQHGAAVHAIEVTRDQSKLITGGSDGKAKIWNLADNKELMTLQGSTEARLLLARNQRDTARQKAAVGSLNKQTETLTKALAKEDEVLKKAGEEHEKAKTNLAAQTTKETEAISQVAKTETLIASAKKDAAQSKQSIEQFTKMVADSTAKSTAIDKELAEGKTLLTTIEKEVTAIQQQIDALTAKKTAAVAKADQARKLVVARQAAKDANIKQMEDARAKIENAKKLSQTAAAELDKSTKALDAQKKAVTAATEAKQKGEAELAKRKQAFETAKSAQARAAAAIPAHQQSIHRATLRQQWLERQLKSAQATVADAGNSIVSIDTGKDQSTAIAYADGSVRVFQNASGQPVIDFAASDIGRPTQVAFVGDYVAALSEHASPVAVNRIPTWVLERTIGTAQSDSVVSDRVTALDFHPSGNALAVGSGPPSRFGDVKVFSVGTGELLRDFGEVHSDTVFGVAFSPDGRRLASAAADKTIRVLDVSTGSLIRSLEGHTHHVLSLAWQDDGQTIASASADQSVKIWNVSTGEQRRTISGFSKEITAVEFVQTSNQIVTACADGNLRLSNTADGKSLRNFSASRDFLFTVRVTPDGKSLIAAGQSGAVRIWNLADGKLIQEWK